MCNMVVQRIYMSPLFLLFVASLLVVPAAHCIMVPSGKEGPIVPPTPRPRRTVPSSTLAPAPVYEEAEDLAANEVDGGGLQYQPPVYRPPLLKHLLLRSHSLKFRQLYAHELPFHKQIVAQTLPKYDRGTTRVKHSDDQALPLAYYRRKLYYSGYPDY